MRQFLKNKFLFAVLGFLALGSCAVGPDYHAPEMKLPDSYMASSKENTAALNSAEWWKALGDPKLNDLIDRAIKNNPSIDIALTHLQEARMQEAVVTGGALPEVGASLGAAKGTGSDLTRGRADSALRAGVNSSDYKHVTQVYGFDAAWEIDLFDKYRREIEAAKYDREAAAAARNNVMVSVIADVVRAYVDVRALQMQQAVLNKNIETMKAYVDVVKQRYDRGITNGLDYALATRELATMEASSAPLGAKLDAARYSLAILLGEFPENMTKELAESGEIPAVPEKLNNGVPLDLLRSRPDINQAEHELAAATARIGVATANLFPSITLTGGAGYQGQGLGVTPVQNNFIWSVGPAVGWPLLDFGTLDALVNISDLETHTKLISYKQKVQIAVEEVDTATSAYAAQQDRLKSLKIALEASDQAVHLASGRYNRGLTDMLNIIDAERQQFDLEQQYVLAEQSAAEQFVALYKALGNGWENYQTIPKIHSPQPAVIAAFRKTLEPSDLSR